MLVAFLHEHFSLKCTKVQKNTNMEMLVVDS